MLIKDLFCNHGHKININPIGTLLQNKIRNNDFLDILKKIRAEFPTAETYFIHLPQKQELLTGEYIIKDIKKEIEKMGISYFPALTECHWQKHMFFVNDPHPNKSGYDNIKDCVSNYLFH